jgi:hypothetical protein
MWLKRLMRKSPAGSHSDVNRAAPALPARFVDALVYRSATA